jgi:acyl dehydratase
MAIDPSSVGTTTEPREVAWTSKDALLYAVGVGAGQQADEELAYTTENTHGVEQQALPTMAVVLKSGTNKLMKALGPFNFANLLHASEAIELFRPLPAEGRVLASGTIAGVYDKGKAALDGMDVTATDPDSGEPWYRTSSSLFIRGEGGWGGDRGPSGGGAEIPERAPDHVVEYVTRPEQALIYRLSGDRNPLHSDPAFARKGGLDRPILHGLCSYGFTGRALLHALCAGDASRFAAMSARFSSPVLPGDSLRVEIWETGDGAASFRTLRTDGTVVIDGGSCTVRS